MQSPSPEQRQEQEQPSPPKEVQQSPVDPDTSITLDLVDEESSVDVVFIDDVEDDKEEKEFDAKEAYKVAEESFFDMVQCSHEVQKRSKAAKNPARRLTEIVRGMRKKVNMNFDDFLNFEESLHCAVAKELGAQLADIIFDPKLSIVDTRRDSSYWTYDELIRNKQEEVRQAKDDPCAAPNASARNALVRKLKADLKVLEQKSANERASMFRKQKRTFDELNDITKRNKETFLAYQKSVRDVQLCSVVSGACVDAFFPKRDITDPMRVKNTFGSLLKGIASSDIVCMDFSDSVVTLTPKMWESLSIDVWANKMRQSDPEPMDGYDLTDETTFQEYMSVVKEMFNSPRELEELRTKSARRFDNLSMLRCALSGIPIYPKDRVIVGRLFSAFESSDSFKKLTPKSGRGSADDVIRDHSCFLLFHADLDQFTAKPMSYVGHLEGRGEFSGSGGDDEDYDVESSEEAYERRADVGNELEELIRDQQDSFHKVGTENDARGKRRRKRRMVMENPPSPTPSRSPSPVRYSSAPINLSSSSSSPSYPSSLPLSSLQEMETSVSPLPKVTPTRSTVARKRKTPTKTKQTPNPAKKSKPSTTPTPRAPREPGDDELKAFLDQLGCGHVFEHVRGTFTLEELKYARDADLMSMGMTLGQVRKTQFKVNQMFPDDL